MQNEKFEIKLTNVKPSWSQMTVSTRCFLTITVCLIDEYVRINH